MWTFSQVVKQEREGNFFVVGVELSQGNDREVAFLKFAEVPSLAERLRALNNLLESKNRPPTEDTATKSDRLVAKVKRLIRLRLATKEVVEGAGTAANKLTRIAALIQETPEEDEV